MTSLTRASRCAAVLLLACLATACGSPTTTATAGSGTSATSTTTTASASPSSSASSTSSAPPQTVMGKRCGRPDVDATMETVDGPDGAKLSLISVGSGGTVALLLHQTNQTGSCGWWPFANVMAKNGIRAVLLDFCGWGLSTCDTSKPWASDYVDQVVRATAKVRGEGATRVTLVGASLGGTVASVAAAKAGVEATANLSGFGFGTLVTAPAIAALTIPMLGAGSHTEQSDSDNLRAQVTTSASPTKRFVWADAGHGWSLVLDGPNPEAPVSAVGTTVIGWVKGDYTA